MDIFKIEKDKLKQFFEHLSKKYNVFTPVESQGVTSFRSAECGTPTKNRIGASEGSHLPNFDFYVASCSYYNTDKSPKEIFFPQSEIILKYTGENVESEAYKGKPIAILGVRPCDAKSFLLLNKVFNNEKYVDTYWQERYKDALVVTLACNTPLSTCFCHWVGGSPFNKESADIFLVDIGNSFLVEACSEKGEKAIHELPLKKDARLQATANDMKLTEERKNKAESMLAKPIELIPLKNVLDKSWDIPLWEELGYRCLECGACSYLCPTCYCFDIQDEGKPTRGERIRIWDSCMFKLFTQEAAGTNPRPTAKERMRQRVMHKFNYFVENLGEFGCVGCGRCIISCPVNIDIREIIKNLRV